MCPQNHIFYFLDSPNGFFGVPLCVVGENGWCLERQRKFLWSDNLYCLAGCVDEKGGCIRMKY